NMATVRFDTDRLYYYTSDNEKIPLNDPSVTILVPSMGDLSAAMFAATFRTLGFNAIALPESNNDILKYGRTVATGKECLPLILCSGALIDYLENRWDGVQKIAFFNVQSAGNCRLGQYPVFLRDLIKRKKYKNVSVLILSTDDGYAGLGVKFSKRGMQALITADVLDDIRSAIMANSVDPDKGMEIFNEQFKILTDKFVSDSDHLYKHIAHFSKEIKKIPARIPIHESNYIALCGEIFVRRDHFSHKYLNKQFAKKGFVVKDAYISEWIKYVDYLIKIGLLEAEVSWRNKLERYIRDFYIEYAERRIKKAFVKSNYYEYHLTDIKPLLDHSKHIVPLDYKGEPCLTIGTALYEGLDHYCGIINLGPFGCMPTRVSEACIMPELKSEAVEKTRQMVDPNYKMPIIFNGKTNIP
ncbi:MAG: hypothetical protein Q8M94_19505, partial [Ignavibacteria bacterium]|nr:hypothetical protein [Ignavibacteria bacterium]